MAGAAVELEIELAQANRAKLCVEEDLRRQRELTKQKVQVLHRVDAALKDTKAERDGLTDGRCSDRKTVLCAVCSMLWLCIDLSQRRATEDALRRHLNAVMKEQGEMERRVAQCEQENKKARVDLKRRTARLCREKWKVVEWAEGTSSSYVSAAEHS